MSNATVKLFPAYFFGLVVMAASTWLLTPLVDCFHWSLAIVIAFLLCLGAVACHVLSKRRALFYIKGYFLNAVGSGCVIAALYAEMEWTIGISSLAIALIPAIALALMLCLSYFSQGKLWRKIWGIVILFLAVVLMVLSVIVWIKFHRVIGSMGFFSSICLLFFLMACLFTLDKSADKWRYLSFSGFWIFAIIAIVVVLILSEGELLDGLDFDIGGGSDKKKKTVK